MNVRLTASVDTASGTSHNFDERVVLFTALNISNNFSRIVETAGNGDFQSLSADGIFRLLNALSSPHLFEFEGCALTAELYRRSSQSRFHNSARRAENRACAARLFKRRIEFSFGKIDEIDARFLYHLRKLARSDSRVREVSELVARNFELFRRTGNNRNHE